LNVLTKFFSYIFTIICKHIMCKICRYYRQERVRNIVLLKDNFHVFFFLKTANAMLLFMNFRNNIGDNSILYLTKLLQISLALKLQYLFIYH